MPYRIVQFRYIKDSEHSGENLIKENIGRKKDALGDAKTLLVSHMEMMEHHEHYIEEWLDSEATIDKEKPKFIFSIWMGPILIYSIEYKVEEYDS